MARILLIDDDDMVRFTLRSALQREGHDVVEAENGAVALDRMRDGGFPLVITDIVMPEKEGIEVIMELRRDYPATCIIAITGGDPQRRLLYSSMANELGADHVLIKPFLDDTLIALIDECLCDAEGSA